MAHKYANRFFMIHFNNFQANEMIPPKNIRIHIPTRELTERELIHIQYSELIYFNSVGAFAKNYIRHPSCQSHDKTENS